MEISPIKLFIGEELYFAAHDRQKKKSLAQLNVQDFTLSGFLY